MDFEEERLITPHATLEDSAEGNKVRPKTLQDYIGQEKVKENMRTGTGTFPNHNIQCKILNGRIQHFLHSTVDTMNFINK